MSSATVVDGSSLRPKAIQAIFDRFGDGTTIGRCIVISLGATSAKIICQTNHGLVSVHDRAVLKSRVDGGPYQSGGDLKLTEYQHAYGVMTYGVASGIWALDIMVDDMEQATEILELLGTQPVTQPKAPEFEPSLSTRAGSVVEIAISAVTSRFLDRVSSIDEVTSPHVRMGTAVAALVLPTLRSATAGDRSKAVDIVDELHAGLWRGIAAENFSLDDVTGVLGADLDDIDDLEIGQVDVGLNTVALQAFLAAMPQGDEVSWAFAGIWRDTDMVDDVAAWSAVAFVRLCNAGLMRVRS